MTRRPDLAVATFCVVPPGAPTAKYRRLGPMALANRRTWCRRHGYPLHTTAPPPDGRPACWGKLAVLDDLLARHEWVLWADADALVLDLDRDADADAFCVDGADLVTASMDATYRAAGVPVAAGRARFPLNTGVFLLRSSPWAHDLLRRADARTELVSAPGPVWDGIGDQEALTAALRERPGDLDRVATVDGLQSHPGLYRPGRDLFVHLYGDRAAHRIPPAEAEAVLRRWEDAAARGGPFPPDLATFHWACIQNPAPGAPDRGGPERFLYRADADGRPVTTRSAACPPSATSSSAPPGPA